MLVLLSNIHDQDVQGILDNQDDQGIDPHTIE